MYAGLQPNQSQSNDFWGGVSPLGTIMPTHFCNTDRADQARIVSTGQAITATDQHWIVIPETEYCEEYRFLKAFKECQHESQAIMGGECCDRLYATTWDDYAEKRSILHHRKQLDDDLYEQERFDELERRTQGRIICTRQRDRELLGDYDFSKDE